MRAELDEVSVYIAKNTDKNISMSEKMTQTDWHMFDRHFSGAESTDYKTTPNGTSPCNHPSLSCQVSCPNFCIKVHSLDDALTYAFMWCSKVKNPILSSPSLHFSNANSNCFHFSRHYLTSLKITLKVLFYNFPSEASYVCNFSGQKFKILKMVDLVGKFKIWCIFRNSWLFQRLSVPPSLLN